MGSRFAVFALLATLASSCAHVARGPANDADAGDFRAQCAARATAKKADPAVCDSIDREFFKPGREVTAIDPRELGAPALPSDHRTLMIAIADPRYVARVAYCYFEFRGWFDPKTLPPQNLALVASGFAILKMELAGYNEWLSGEKGQTCRRNVAAYAGRDIADLHQLFREHDALIAVNPIAAIKEGVTLDDVKKDALLTLNHERIHVLHVLCKDLDAVAKRMWSKLSAADKEAMGKKFASYDWSNPVVAVRENLALRHEDDPGSVLALAKSCRYR